jgi:hypothetical protein
MHPKDALRQKARRAVEDLPDSCRDDFYRLLSLLTKYNEQADQRKAAYETWVASLFEQYRDDGICCFCGAPVAADDNGGQEFCCSANCSSEWKRHVMLVLAAYL